MNHPKYGDIALKIGTYQTPQNPNGWEIERIEREIDCLQKIDSPYYPKNYGFEKISNSRFIVYEEFVDSVPLSKCMDRFQEPLPILKLLLSITEGLSIIWSMNIVHRDLKPENILITCDNEPKIIDLGIARVLDNDSLTATGFSGPCTRSYAAPELLMYEKKLINHRTDQFSLGIIFVQMLLKGQHPFDTKLVGGKSIPENIITGNWYKDIFEEEFLKPLNSLASKCLSIQQFGRFRDYNALIRKIKDFYEVY